MGYSHYWTPNDVALSDENRALLHSLLMDGARKGILNVSKVSKRNVVFNGVDGCESLNWVATAGGRRCSVKTNMLPYDPYVCATLYALYKWGCLKLLFSDGFEARCDAWEDAVPLIRTLIPGTTVEDVRALAMEWEDD